MAAIPAFFSSLTAAQAVGLASTAMQALGQIQQGQAANAAAKYNASILEQNARVERQQAMQREEQQRRQAGQILGQQRAAYAQAGGGMGGSALDVATQSGRDAELDALTLRYEGELRARGLETSAAMERFAGQQARTHGYMSSAGTILGGVGDYMSSSANAKARSATLNRVR